jgi:hypothetical protein
VAYQHHYFARQQLCVLVANQSAAGQQVQLLQAEVELQQLRDRVRKSLRKWLGGEAQRQKGPPIRIDWQLPACELVEHLCCAFGNIPRRSPKQA